MHISSLPYAVLLLATLVPAIQGRPADTVSPDVPPTTPTPSNPGDAAAPATAEKVDPMIHPDRYVMLTVNNNYICVKPIGGYPGNVMDNSTWSTVLKPATQGPDATCIFYFSTPLGKNDTAPQYFMFSPLANQDGQRINLSVRRTGRFGAGAASANETDDPSPYFSGPPLGGKAVTPGYHLQVTGDEKSSFRGQCLGENPYISQQAVGGNQSEAAIYWKDMGGAIPLACTDRFSTLTAIKLVEKTTPVATVSIDSAIKGVVAPTLSGPAANGISPPQEQQPPSQQQQPSTDFQLMNTSGVSPQDQQQQSQPQQQNVASQDNSQGTNQGEALLQEQQQNSTTFPGNVLAINKETAPLQDPQQGFSPQPQTQSQPQQQPQQQPQSAVSTQDTMSDGGQAPQENLQLIGTSWVDVANTASTSQGVDESHPNAATF